jgi:hypothetical protein
MCRGALAVEQSGRAPRLDAVAMASSSGCGGRSALSRQPGTMMVRASASRSNPPSASTMIPPIARTRRLSAETTPNSYQDTPSSGRVRPKISTAMPNSNVHRPS